MPQFGKQLQAEIIPGWSEYYLDYKFLKKIVSSLAAKRPASEAASLALGIRPVGSSSFQDPASTNTTNTTNTSSSSSSYSPSSSPLPHTPTHHSILGASLERDSKDRDEENHGGGGPSVPVPMQVDFDEPPVLTTMGQDDDRGPDFQAHKAAFFFKLERELEKVRDYLFMATNEL